MTRYQVGCNVRSVVIQFSYCPECASTSMFVRDSYQQCDVCNTKFSLETSIVASPIINCGGEIRSINKANILIKDASTFVEDPNEEVWEIKLQMIGKFMDWLFSLDQSTLAKAWKLSLS